MNPKDFSGSAISCDERGAFRRTRAASEISYHNEGNILLSYSCLNMRIFRWKYISNSIVNINVSTQNFPRLVATVEQSDNIADNMADIEAAIAKHGNVWTLQTNTDMEDLYEPLHAHRIASFNDSVKVEKSLKYGPSDRHRIDVCTLADLSPPNPSLFIIFAKALLFYQCFKVSFASGCILSWWWVRCWGQ